MNEFERRIRQMINPLSTRVTRWWNDFVKFAENKRAKGVKGTADLRHEATARAQQAASRMHDLRDSGAAKRAEAALHDMRDSGAGKRAGAALHDLRDSGAGKRAEHALADLRQREPVKKAEESTRKVVHDLFSGGPDKSDKAGSAKAS